MSTVVRVAVDAMGGDHAPHAIVAGASAAARPGTLEVMLAGDEQAIAALLPRPLPPAVSLVDMEPPLAPMGAGGRRGRHSSVETTCALVRDGQADAMVSAGPTGPAVATAALSLRRAPGIRRPALAVTLPGARPTVLVDAGAVPDATPEMIAQFAVLGACYAEARLGVTEPSVGLLNIGTEPGKGNRLARATHDALRQAPVRFHGNVEGGDLVAGIVDVIVTDGFTGNVALKAIEATLGLGPEAQRTDVDSAAALVGLEHTVLLTHGAVRATGVTTACQMAERLVRHGVTEAVRRRLESGA